VTSDFTLHFLALGKHGPIKTLARVLRQDQASALVRVEVRDSSPDERLLAVATGTAEPLE
jgi:acyl-coenzyme A thioesterase PaaI-like protein